MRTIHLSLVVTVLVLLAATASSAYVYPTVVFDFDSVTHAYNYTVTVTPQNDFPLGYLELDTLVKNAGITAWTMLGPTNVDIAWSTRSWEYETGHDAANWYVKTSLGQQEIYPSNGTWVGTFTLIAPNTQPGEGFALTMDGEVRSQHAFTINVPGPVVPEPCSLLALGTGLLGTASMLVKRRKL